MITSRNGILLTNTGTPNEPNARALWRYLKEFLLDKRIVQMPQWLWQPLLYSVVLPRRAFYSANLYRKIWTEHGSPMRHWMEKIRETLQQNLQQDNFEIALGMHYGTPSIKQGLEELRRKKVDRLIVLPLFPQYSLTTTASSFDKVTAALQHWPLIPQLHFVHHYADHPAYIKAYSQHIKLARQAPHLLFSFHGIPQLYVDRGDTYPQFCQITAAAIAKELQLAPNSWSISYQSRFGYSRWLKPYTNEVLQELAQRGVTEVDVVCPGFSVDCLETLEEIAIRAKEQFLLAGGKSFRYIPALNNKDEHIQTLNEIIYSTLSVICSRQ